MMLKLIILAVFVCLVHSESVTHSNGAKDAKDRALETLQQMTLAEKITLMSGDYGTYEGNIPGIERLGIPGLHIQDGPQGLRTKVKTGGPGTTTSWPSSLTITSSWDPDLLHEWATEMAKEFRAKGVNLQLGPGIGLARVPTAGRNWEYLSGEDPILGAKLVSEVIKGIQGQGVIANAKHFINNEIENHRMTVSANIDERTQFEIYYPPFQAAIDAGVLSMMCSYNRINDVYACQNNETLSHHLREIMGFEGFVMSDWTATKSTSQSLKAGLDMEMPYNLFFNNKTIDKALSAGEITENDIDTAVLRTLTAIYAIGLVDNPYNGEPKANVTSEAHNQLARRIAGESTVLLKNSAGLLPLNQNEEELGGEGGCIAVIGDETTVTGLGSGSVSGPYVITPAQGIANALAAKGLSTTVLFSNGSDVNEATALAAKCGTSIVTVATTAREGEDRENLSLGDAQNALVSAVAAATPKGRTVVTINCPGAVLLTPWVEQVSTILISWLPGQEAGNALADVIFGLVNPSARLPLTFPNKENEVGFTARQYPGVGFPPEATYSEGLLVGYRWYHAKEVKPLFPFGHGLSYTTFQYEDMKLVRGAVTAKKFANRKGLTSIAATTVAEVKLRVRNVGAREGAEVVQLYLTYPKAAREPPKQLRNFVKKVIPAGAQSEELSLTLTERDVAIWKEEEDVWEIVPGEYQVAVGASSEDIRFTSSFIVK